MKLKLLKSFWKLKNLGLKSLLLTSLLLFWQLNLIAAYRAYYYEVSDVVNNASWEALTGFDPVSYLRTHGKQGQIKIFIKASWICEGITSFEKVCPMPATLGAKFSLGEKVRVTIKGHLTENWQGVIEQALWRKDLNSNVYGIRFENNNKLFGNYFEKDLALVK